MRKLFAVFVALLLSMPMIVSAQQTAATPPAATSVQAPASAASLSVPVPVPQPSPKAIEYYKSGNWLWIADTLWGFLIPALILFTGFSATMRNWAKKLGKYWYFTLLLYFVLFSLVMFAIDFALG